MKKFRGNAQRAPNFQLSEEVLLIRLVLQHADIVESKNTDSATNAEKEKTWHKITISFNAAAPFVTRDQKALYLKYKNIKKSIKDTMATAKKEGMATGSGLCKENLKFKDVAFYDLYEALRLPVDGHVPVYDDDAEDVNTQTKDDAEVQFEADYIKCEYESSQSSENQNFDVVQDTGGLSPPPIRVSSPSIKQETEISENNKFKVTNHNIEQMVLSDPLNDYSEAIPKNQKRPAVRHLTHHRSSVKDGRNNLQQMKLQLMQDEIDRARELHRLNLADRQRRNEQETKEHELRMIILRAQLKNALCKNIALFRFGDT